MIDDVPGQLELCDEPLFPVATASTVDRAPDIVLPYEDGRFRCIEIDPPWQYRDRGYNGFAGVQAYRIHCPYDTMSIDEIRAMGPEINRVANAQAHLWMWVTKDYLPDGFDLIRAWGWHYKQIVTWVKTTKDGRPTYGMGHWLRNGTEFLLLAVNTKRGNLPLERTTTPNYIHAPRLGHSAKPEAAYGLIRANSPEPRLSIFQRTAREGFECWGNEMPMEDPHRYPANWKELRAAILEEAP